MHELILGGGKSGKSRCAEARAKNWLQRPGRRALLIATALPGDPEMRERISRHRAQRTLHQRVAAACGRVTLMVAGIEMGVKA